ncbi:MAG: cell division FtsA domain-containing protein [Paludibacteraceae bacterium]|nr:cell division FtsA domain-containing protein [Paludibacteraceae bacterium]
MMAKKQQQQKADSLPLVAIDLGSSGVRAIAAECVGEDMFRILGTASSHREGGVKQGTIESTANVGFMINEVLRLLANTIHIDNLPTAFVLLGGRSMQAVDVAARRDQVHRLSVSPQLLTDMRNECIAKIERSYPEFKVFDVIPSCYVLDGVPQEDIPTNAQKAAKVDVYYTAFAAKKELDSRLNMSFDRAGKSIESSFIRADVLLSVFQCQEAREQDNNDIFAKGCAVIDMGAQTTTLTIYKGGAYLVSKVYPRGGDDVTSAIAAQLQISQDKAEQLKQGWGVASPNFVEDKELVAISKTKAVDLAAIIEAKLNEIFEPVWKKLNEYTDRIECLYITGGASMLQGMYSYVCQHNANLDVRYGMHDYLLTTDTDEEFFKPVYSDLVGALLAGQDYRNQHKDEPVKKPNFIQKVEDALVDLFTAQY